MGYASFQLMMIISFTVKQPLAHFVAWGQKNGKEWKKQIAHAKPNAYLGPTPLSKLVTYVGKKVESEMSSLLLESRRGQHGLQTADWGGGRGPRAT